MEIVHDKITWIWFGFHLTIFTSLELECIRLACCLCGWQECKKRLFSLMNNLTSPFKVKRCFFMSFTKIEWTTLFSSHLSSVYGSPYHRFDTLFNHMAFLEVRMRSLFLSFFISLPLTVAFYGVCVRVYLGLKKIMKARLRILNLWVCFTDMLKKFAHWACW